MDCEELECFHQSFQGSGSLYIGKRPSEVSLTQLEKYTIRAIILLSSSQKIPFSSRNEVLSIPPHEKDPLKLRNNFHVSYDFIQRQRKRTNILIISSQGRSISIAFALAYLMKKYRYDLEYLSRLLNLNPKNLCLSEEYEYQLKKISAEFQKEKDEEESGDFLSSKLGRRIVRIRRDYGKIAEGSRFKSLSRRASEQINPECLPLNTGRKSSQRKLSHITAYYSVSKPLFHEERYCK